MIGIVIGHSVTQIFQTEFTAKLTSLGIPFDQFVHGMQLALAKGMNLMDMKLKSCWLRLVGSYALLVILTVVQPITSSAANDCRALFVQSAQIERETGFEKQGTIQLSVTREADEAKIFEVYFRDRVSPRYQRKWTDALNRWHREFIAEVVKLNGRELYALRKFGFEFVGQNEIVAPPFDVFAKNYSAYLDEMGIPESKRIRPALSLESRDTKEVVLVRPGIDSWPSGTAWGARPLRLKARQMAQNVSEGRFPVFEGGSHDIVHFLLFALHPDYAEQIRTGNSKLLQDMSKGFMSRAAFNLEALSLADPTKINEIRMQITIKKPTPHSTFRDFQSAVQTLPVDALIARAEYWKRSYQDFLVYYSAGMREPYERQVYRNFVGTSYLPTTLPSELLAGGMTHLDVVVEKRTTSLRLASSSTKEQESHALMALQDAVAKVEYALWASATRINLAQWMKDTMRPDIDLQAPTFGFIVDIFGVKSPVYQLMVRPNSSTSNSP